MTEYLFGVIPRFGSVSSISLALHYIFCPVNGEILTKICVGLDVNGLLFLSNFKHFEKGQQF